MKIPLTRGMFAEIDDADVSLVSGHRWHVSSLRPNGVHYAQARIGGKRGKLIYMHRLLLGFPALSVDHMDGDGLNNRRGNLREATRAEQARNSRASATKRSKTSAHKGVSYWDRPKWIPRSKTGCWKAALWTGEKTIARYAKTETEAARLYNEMAREHFGAFAKLNAIEEAASRPRP